MKKRVVNEGNKEKKVKQKSESSSESERIETNDDSSSFSSK